MDELTPADLVGTVTAAAIAMVPHSGRDWSLGAGDLSWTCRRTLDHTIDTLLWYSGNLAMLATERRQHVRDGDPNGSIERLLDALVSSCHILARVAEATPKNGRGYHGAGMADATGFLAMGCNEILIHAYDICSGLGEGFNPPPNVCEQVVARIFPWAPKHDDAWERLLWCNGRLALPKHPRIGPEWGWWCAPLEEWDGVAYTERWPGA